MKTNVFIFHGTEGYPEENWFPWLKAELEKKNYSVFVPQFPTPPVVPAKISEWFNVLKDYQQYINQDTVFVAHSLGGKFLLRVLESLDHQIKAAFLWVLQLACHQLQIMKETTLLRAMILIGMK